MFHKITTLGSLALFGLIISTTNSTLAQHQDSPSDIGGINSATINGELHPTSDARVSNLYSKFSSANDLQRQAIIDSLQGIVQQLQNQQTMTNNSSHGTATQSYPTTSYPAESYSSQPTSVLAPVQIQPAYEAPMSIPTPVVDSMPMMAAPMPIAPAPVNVVNNYYSTPAPVTMPAPAPMPQPQSFVEYGPVFTPPPTVIRPVIKVLVPVVVPTFQPERRHGCRLFHH